MKSMPRILPLVGVAIGGVLAINALAGARDLPALLSGAQAFAENAAKTVTPAKAKAAKPDPKGDPATAKAPAPGETGALTGEAMNAAATGLPPPTISPRAVCAPTAAELAKEAGLSPAELQVLQNLGERRGQLDKRENDLSTQTALMAAAEAKVDAKLKALTALKADVQGLLAQANGKEASEVDRLVKVFEGMKPKDAAPRFVLLDDSVRLPIAAKMKEKSLSSMLAIMPPADAKKLTESLARRFAAAQTLAQNANAVANAAEPPAGLTPDKAAKPARKAPPKLATKAPRKAAPADAEAAATPQPPAAVPAAPSPAPKVG